MTAPSVAAAGHGPVLDAVSDLADGPAQARPDTAPWDPRHAAGCGTVEFSRVAGRTAVTRARAHSPLRLFMPARRGRAAWVLTGSFGGGFVGEQFALPEAVEALRAVRKQGPTGQLVVVSACDPLNVVGCLTPGERVPAVLSNKIVFKDGVPVCSLENGDLVNRWNGEGAVLAKARALLSHSPAEATAEPVPA